jgi:hypothetical protein
MQRKKLSLDPVELRVESFRTLAGSGARGTVQGHGYTEPGYPSCALTCGASPPQPTVLCGRAGDPRHVTVIECCY